METNDVCIKKQWFIKSKTGNIEEFYELDLTKPLGTGAFGTVFRGRLKASADSAWRAIKKIPKRKVKDPSEFMNEIEILQKLDHPHIIKLYETYEDARNIYMVTELCTGGELFDKIIEKGTFSEEEARVVFKQMMLALNYCHSQKIAHRDLKPENFLLLNKEPNSPIKLIDFGLSFRFSNAPKAQRGMKTLVGTSYYIAPEVMEGKYDHTCDIWSAGVILYILVTSIPPFNGESDNDIMDQVRTMKYSLNIPEMKNISSSLKDLISKILVEASKRPSAEEILNHPWLNTKTSSEPLKINFNNFKNFCHYSRFKKIAVTLIATQLQEKDILQLGNLFKQIDKNNDGVLTIDEIKQALDSQKENASYAELKKILDNLDSDHSGSLNYTEFIAGCLEQSMIIKDENLHMAFRLLDINNDGKVSRKELEELLSRIALHQYQSCEEYKLSNKDLDELIKTCDRNGDGEIDYNEFLNMMAR